VVTAVRRLRLKGLEEQVAPRSMVLLSGRSVHGPMNVDGKDLVSLFADAEGMDTPVWIDVHRPDEDVRRMLLEDLAFEELAVEDVFGYAPTSVQRFEDDRVLVINARDADNRLDTEPVSVFMRGSVLMTLRRAEIPAMRTFGRRLAGADRDDLALGVDYLLYELLDTIADDWAPRLTAYSDALDRLEHQIFAQEGRDAGILEELHDLKRHLREAAKSIESLHFVVIRLLKPGDHLVSVGTHHYFNDVQQLVGALMRRANNYSQGATSARESHISNVNLRLAKTNARLSEVMTTLTITGAIMLPLTLIAGIFGMNTALPVQAESLGGFWGIIGLMVLFAVSMLGFFWRRGWLSNPTDD
jgi:magnesium transporter